MTLAPLVALVAGGCGTDATIRVPGLSAGAGRTLVASGTTGVLVRSGDGGQSWAPVTSAVAGTLDDVGQDGSGHWLSMGIGGICTISNDDALSWGSCAGTPASVFALARDNTNRWVAVGAGVVHQFGLATAM